MGAGVSRARTIKSRSKASLALAHCGKSTAELARVLGISDTMVDYLLSGYRRGSVPLRKKIKKELGIEISWWEEPAPKDSADVLAKIRSKVEPHNPFPEFYDNEPALTTSGQIRDLAGEYTDRVRKFMREVEADKLLSFPERSRILRECAISLDKAGRITGASSEIAISKILKSPAWTKLGKIIADSILAYGDEEIVFEKRDEKKKVAAAILRRVGEALKGAE